MPEKIEKADLTTQSALLGWYKPVYVRETSDNAVLTSEEVLLSTWRPVYLPWKIEKQFSPLSKTCDVGASLFYVRERLDNAVLTSEEVL